MKNDFIDMRLQLSEICSCMVILQKAVENESEEICSNDISNYLEIAIDKTKVLIEMFDNITEAKLKN